MTTSLRLDKLDAASYARGRHNANQRTGILPLTNGTGALMPTPTPKVTHIWRPSTKLTVWVNGIPMGAKIERWSRNPFEAEVYVCINGLHYVMTLKALEAMTVAPDLPTNAIIRLEPDYQKPVVFTQVNLGSWGVFLDPPKTMGIAV